MILGIGTDMVEIDRIQSAIEKNPRFLQRVYTMQEIESCQRKSNCWQSFAARFAAKEAVSKAFGTGIGQIGFTEIEIKNMAGGPAAGAAAWRSAGIGQGTKCTVCTY